MTTATLPLAIPRLEVKGDVQLVESDYLAQAVDVPVLLSARREGWPTYPAWNAVSAYPGLPVVRIR